jgi:hypothetical protein
MKPKKSKIYKGGTLNEVTVTPYTKNKYDFEQRMNNKATGGLKPVYPIADALIGRALFKAAKPTGALIKKSLGRAKKGKTQKALQAVMAARDIKEYTGK